MTAGRGRPREAVQDERFELRLDPARYRLCPAGIVIGKSHLPLGVNRHRAGEAAAVEVAGDAGGEAGEVAPLRPRGDRLLEEGDGGRVGVLALWGPFLGGIVSFPDLYPLGVTRRACCATVAVCWAFGSWEPEGLACSRITRKRALESPGRACR